MHQKLTENSEVIEQASAALLKEYDPVQLYAFRVSARRIRSILKHIGSHRSRRFRKAWGGFSAITNESRDWDVFLLTVENLLPAPDYGEFRALHEENIQACHAAVLDMLSSVPWQRHLQEWRISLERAVEDAGEAGGGGEALAQALAKARLVLARALDLDDDRSWHKFRIAVKEVRYVADTGGDDPEEGSYLAGLIENCKALQTLLGDWHDTVVQIGMLEELESAPVHETLALLIPQRKQEFLAQIRDVLSERDFFPPQP